jgi:hypothetical protein
MSALTSSHREDTPRSRKLDQAYRLYRRRIARCRTENQVNRLHIAVENYITPLEVRYFNAVLAGESLDAPSREWIVRLHGLMPVRKVRPVEFERRGLVRGATRYTADVGTPAQKTLIVAFCGALNRLMLPMPTWLDCLNPAFYDMIVMRDFSRRFFSMGIPGLGSNFFETLAAVRKQVDFGSYRNTIALGTSSGGLSALLAAVHLKMNRGISIGGIDFPTLAGRLRDYGVNDAPYEALLAARFDPFPDLVLAYCGGHAVDAAAASALSQRVPSRLWEVKDCKGHGVVPSKLRRGRFPPFLSNILGQSIERPDSVPAAVQASEAFG